MNRGQRGGIIASRGVFLSGEGKDSQRQKHLDVILVARDSGGQDESPLKATEVFLIKNLIKIVSKTTLSLW